MKYFLMLFVWLARSARANDFIDKPNGFLDTCGLANKYGYPCEPHEVTTDDGYILQHFRIPRGKNAVNNGQAVLLQHGLMGTSSHWLYIDEISSLGYILADAGCDVWLMNTRGNKYSNKNSKNMTGRVFWNFSYTELGLFDIPNTIDYILSLTKQQKVIHIGYSQGTTSMYVLLSEKPEYNDKIALHISYSPVAYNQHVSSILFKALEPLERLRLLTLYRQIFGDFDFVPEINLLKIAASIFCQKILHTNIFCKWISYALFGHAPNELKLDALPTIFGHFPNGAAFKQSVHYIQMIISGEFQDYDNGPAANIKIYGSSEPPKFNISNIKAPIVAFYGANDALAPKIDVEKFLPLLTSLVAKYDMGECAHNDFLVSNTVAARIYKITIDLVNQFRTK